MLELIDRDAAGRICRFTVNNKTIQTPDIAIVIDTEKMLINPKELEEEFNTDLIITNAYLMHKRPEVRKQVLEKGLHSFLNFNKVIMTDSGAYQMMFGNKIDMTNREIIEFQEKIKPDIGTFLDIPSRDLPHKEATKTVLETIKRAKECKNLTKGSKIMWSCPVQGGSHLDLVAKSAKQSSKLGFEFYPVGSIVPRMIRYDYKTVCEQIITAKMNLPSNVPVHAFGLGNPNFMALAVAIGADIFDSAAYALYAYDDRYMTVSGTYKLEDLKEFPCSCRICSEYTPDQVKQMKKQDRELLLSKHNLYVTYSELRTIKQAIRDNALWELVQQRVRAHPKLLEALIYVLKKYPKYFLERDLFTKKSAFMYLGEESAFRPEVMRAKQKLKRMKNKTVRLEPFGKIPKELLTIYPFGQSVLLQRRPKVKADPKKIVEKIIEYQYGSKFKTKFRVEASKKTGRIRRVWKDKVLLGTIRANDGVFIPTSEGAKYIKMKKVIIRDDEVISYVKEGKSLFAKFIDECDDFAPGEEIAISDGKKIIALGRALLNPKEIREFNRGVAVKIR